jgi:uncharacterized protein
MPTAPDPAIPLARPISAESPVLVRIGPVPERDRIESLDVLRGLAVLGILVMNIQSFAMPSAAYDNPATFGNLDGDNYAVWLGGQILCNGKFYGMFSMLFGAGIVLMSSRCERTGRSATGIHYRRMLALLVIGLAHAHLVWSGDILYFYAVCGTIVYWAKRWRPIWLILTGVVLIAVTSGMMELGYAHLQALDGAERAQALAEWFPGAGSMGDEIEAYRGGWLDQLPLRSRFALDFEIGGLVFFVGASASGLMLLGMALFKLGALHARWPSWCYALLIAAAVGIGVPVILIGVNRIIESGWRRDYVSLRGAQYNYWAAPLLSLGWIGLIMLLCRHRALTWLTRPLSAAGRMALTNYLMQSVICTTIFYGHGFGRFGRVERTGQLAVVVAVWLVQLIASPWWMSRFRFGPAEWAWRWATYGRRPTLSRSTA